MFKKKRSNSSLRHAHTNPPAATASAATAAAQAFIKQQQGDSALSNAAAAAALRTVTPSPVPISDIQTKRMQRRGSTSSIGSVTSNSRQPFSSSLQRRGSQSSMSQRSFRSPSPSAANAPPVPALPDDVPPIPVRSQMRQSRPNSTEPSHSRPASVQAYGGRSSGIEASQWAAADAKKRSTMAAIDTAIGRAQAAVSPSPASPRSINFSRPMSPSFDSPSASPTAARGAPRPASSLGLTQAQYDSLRMRSTASPTPQGKVTMVFDPASRRMVPAIIQHDLQPEPASSSAMVYDAASRKMVPASQAAPRIPERDFTHTASGAPARAMSLTSASIAAARPRPRVVSPQPRTSSMTSQTAPPPVQRPMSLTSAVAPPTAEQIKAFQTRAASMLARPPPQMPQAQPPKQNQRPTSMLMKTPSTENARAPPAAVPGPAAAPSALQPVQERAVATAKSIETPVQRVARNEKSASPARSARFSDSPLLDVTKHRPLPRSASPGKSALKGHSPGRQSPAASRNRDSAALSDAGSAVSDESNATGKKRKSVRVSFEEKPILVGQSAGSSGVPGETVMSPQYKKALRDLGDDDVQGMGERPALPSFGSVRGRRTRADGEAMDEPESPTSLAHPSVETLQKAAQEPADSSAVAAPEIAVLPATPLVETGDVLSAHVPAGTEEALSAQDAPTVAKSHPAEAQPGDGHPWASTHPVDETASDTDDDVAQFSDAAEDQAELDEPAGFRSLDAILESPSNEEPNPISEPMDTKVINEIVEEEPLDHANPVAVATTADTAVPLAAVADAPAAIQADDLEDWDTVKAYWSSLSEQKKREIEMQASLDSSALLAGESAGGAPGPALKSALKKQTLEDEDQRLPPWPDTQYQRTAKPRAPAPAPAKTPAARPAPVSREPSEPTHMRNSMRSGGSLRTSMHEPPKSHGGQAPKQRANKPVSAASTASPEAIALARAVMPKPEPKRRGSDASDGSDSSFRKRRGRNPEPRYTMKASMRDGMRAETEMSPPPASSSGRKPMRTSVRGGSIDSTNSEQKGAGGFFGLGKSKAKPAKPGKSKGRAAGASSGSGFKSRFANSSDEDSDDNGGGSRLGGFRSRFANSDDDDSDYESQQAFKLTPVRGIPRRAGQNEGDSTDLDDSDDEQPPAGKPPAQRPATPPSSAPAVGSPASAASPPPRHANGAAAAQGKVLSDGSLRSQHAPDKRRSIFSLSKSKRSAAASSGGPASPASPALADSKWATAAAATGSPGSPSAARRADDRPSSRHSFFRRRLSFGSTASAAPAPAAADGKTDFPFPPPPIPQQYRTVVKPRPNTSDGGSNPSSATRPPLGDRGESTQTAPLAGAGDDARRLRKRRDDVYSERTGRKKKFQGLRRALGLHD